MAESLPYFKYHPNPIETGNLEASDKACLCCSQNRGYIYTSSVYSMNDLDESICPWCIADGSAAEKFDATFNNCQSEPNISPEIIEELSKGTPGYECWQSDIWLYHCNDACEFHGDLSKKEAKSLDEKTVEKFSLENGLDKEDAKGIIQYYEKGGNPAIYKFVCRHCGEIKLYTDFT